VKLRPLGVRTAFRADLSVRRGTFSWFRETEEEDLSG
jgi:hypothetical protein